MMGFMEQLEQPLIKEPGIPVSLSKAETQAEAGTKNR